ncbi:MAG: tyrosine--tRNA ligase [Ignavibacteriae bacterium]|nr:tyrosine--tRNA ligase [Ignavibacteriota bacterium]
MQMFPTLNEQMDLIRSGAVEIIPEDELVKKIEISIKKNKPLIIKLGCDPSRPDLHIGHAVVLHKMRQFQDLGHHALLIIGDFTGMIGDPTGKNVTRPHLTLEETRINGQSYLEQAIMVLAKDELEVRYNSEWLGKMSFRDVIELTAKYTVAQILERDDFSNRYKSGQPISIHELLYPLAQAMDSAAIHSDVELGGTDQKFNLLVGREIQKAYNMPPQVILTMPLLEGTDGVEKMSKSYNNYIAFNDTPRDIFGKVMSIPDNLIVRYFRYGARASEKDIKEMEEQLKSDSFNPRDAKVRTAKAIVAIYYGGEAGENALAEFDKIFKNKDIPDEIEEMKLDLPTAIQPLMDVLVLTNLVPSKKEAKRLIVQGGVMIDGEKVSDFRAEIDLSRERLLKVGKRKFLKVTI